jgi:glycosyltransferase involved in cell wall biosynthesis
MHQTSKPKLLAVGQGLAPTGFARVLDSLLVHLVDRWEVHHFALHYRGPRRDEPWTVHPNDRRGDVYGLAQLGPLLESVRPDVVLILEDPSFLPLHLEIVARHGQGAGTAVYCPMDFDIPSGMAADIAAAADFVVAYTEAGRQALMEAGLPRLRIDVLPHGIDPGRFRPLGAD